MAKRASVHSKASRAARQLLEEQVTYEVLLNMIIQDIRSSFDLPEILQRTAVGVGEAIHCSHVHVGTYNSFHRHFLLSGIYTDPPSFTPIEVITLVDDWDLVKKMRPFSLPDLRLMGVGMVQSTATITRPRSQSPANGIIIISHQDPQRQWHDWELALIQAVGEHVGVLLAWHELLSRQQEDFWVAQTIHRISTNIRQTLDMGTIVHTLEQELVIELQLPILQLWDRQRDGLLHGYQDPLQIPNDVAQWLGDYDQVLPSHPEPQLHRNHFQDFWVYTVALTPDIELRTASRQRLSQAQERVLTAVARSANGVLLQAKAQQQMAELNQLKTSLISNVSHELRTPLTSILLLVSSLLEDEDLDAETLEMLQLVKQESQRLNVLISDLLDYSRLEADKTPWILSSLELPRLCQAVDHGILPLYQQKQQRLVWEIPSTLPRALGIPERITQVLVNLLTNAHKFSGVGSPVTVRMAVIAGPKIRIEVEDRGKGIPAEEIDRIFDRFAQVQGTQGGTGLGLAICREIVQRLGGEIGVQSQLGQGSCFWFTVQIAKEADAA
ncbi:MAG: hypothetical protein OHK0012_13140 [Synechococcales cyanobacterium]